MLRQRVISARAAAIALLVSVLPGCKSNQVNATNDVCEGKFQDCDRDPSNQCETNTEQDLRHCGACGAACPDNHGSASCVESRCKLECWAGFADCDGDPSNGCETDLSSSKDSCGACGKACTGANAESACVGGVCQLTCASGFGDCNKMTADGCEQRLDSSTHCGACGKSCAKTGTVTSCVDGKCVDGGCSSGYHDCGGTCMSDSSPASCGASCSPCPAAPAGGMATCASGTCDFSCVGTTRCGDLCIDTATSASNCGACGRSCGTTACVSGLCVPEKLAKPASGGILVVTDTYVWGQDWRVGKSTGVLETSPCGPSPDGVGFGGGGWVGCTRGRIFKENAAAGSLASLTLATGETVMGWTGSKFLYLKAPTASPSATDGAFMLLDPVTDTKTTLRSGLRYNCGASICRHQAAVGTETWAFNEALSSPSSSGWFGWLHGRLDGGGTGQAGTGNAFALDAVHTYRTGWPGTSTAAQPDLYRRKTPTDVDELVLTGINGLVPVGADARGTYFIASVSGAVTSAKRALYRIAPGSAVSTLKAIYTADLSLSGAMDSSFVFLYDFSRGELLRMRRPD